IPVRLLIGCPRHVGWKQSRRGTVRVTACKIETERLAKTCRGQGCHDPHRQNHFRKKAAFPHSSPFAERKSYRIEIVRMQGAGPCMTDRAGIMRASLRDKLNAAFFAPTIDKSAAGGEAVQWFASTSHRS